MGNFSAPGAVSHFFWVLIFCKQAHCDLVMSIHALLLAEGTVSRSITTEELHPRWLLHDGPTVTMVCSQVRLESSHH